MIGKTVQEAKELLASQGVTEFEVVNNFSNQQNNGTLLVTACKVEGKKATLVVGSFLLDL